MKKMRDMQISSKLYLALDQLYFAWLELNNMK